MISTTSRVAPKWVRNRSDEAAVDAGCWFDQQSADRVRYFFARFLRHSKGTDFAGKPFTLLDWQWDRVIAPLFGWRSPDGTRRFRRCGVAIPKKNGKSTLLSGLGIYLLCGDGEPGAEVYSAAASRDQASIIYNESANMVRASPALSARIAPKDSKKEMTFGACIYKALSADVPTKEGLNIHALLFDEIHAQPNWDLWNTLRYGFAARRQPLLIWITTAGVYDPTALGYTQWQDAKAIQESRAVDTSFLPCIYEADEADDWTSEEVWKRTNPSYGTTIPARDFAEALQSAKRIPSEESIFRRYRINQWVRQESPWLPIAEWLACRASYTAKDLRRKKCIGGLDLASTTDIAALVLLFKDKDTRKHRLLPFFWLPSDAIERRRRENKTRLDAWAHKQIKIVPGKTLDYSVLRQDINTLRETYQITDLAVDPWNATQLSTDLESDGFKVQYVRQGFASISAATKEFERLVLNQQIEHNGDPVLEWMIGNVAVEQDASGNVKPSKRRSSEKIDGVAAAITALALAIVKQGKQKTVYEDKKVEIL
jgi:phage terminase large subunit-like protein